MKKILCQVLGHEYVWTAELDTLCCLRCGHLIGAPVKQKPRPTLRLIWQSIQAWIIAQRK